jgi:hypothetical protein
MHEWGPRELATFIGTDRARTLARMRTRSIRSDESWG